jgi:hypothetical protein
VYRYARSTGRHDVGGADFPPRGKRPAGSGGDDNPNGFDDTMIF